MPSRKPREPRLDAWFPTRSDAMRALLDTAARVLDHSASLLITGESGVGKDHLAKAIHACSERRSEPFVHVSLASTPADLFESELFGHERGTFTDAAEPRAGKLEVAQGGTVYLDEIESIAPGLQAKLLRAVEERKFTRLGGSAVIRVQARVIASSSSNVGDLLRGGTLRPDLYYRLNVVTLEVPPLRERPEDILPLAEQFLRESDARCRGFDDAARALLQSHSWPGNVRELRNNVVRAAIVGDAQWIRAADLSLSSGDEFPALAAKARWSLDEVEAHYIREVLRLTGSHFGRAAEILGINRKTLLEKRKKHGLP